MSGLAFFSGLAKGVNSVISDRMKMNRQKELLDIKHKWEKEQNETKNRLNELKIQDLADKAQRAEQFISQINQLANQNALQGSTVNYDDMSIKYPSNNTTIGMNKFQYETGVKRQKALYDIARGVAKINTKDSFGTPVETEIKLTDEATTIDYLINKLGINPNDPDIQLAIKNKFSYKPEYTERKYELPQENKLENKPKYAKYEYDTEDTNTNNIIAVEYKGKQYKIKKDKLNSYKKKLGDKLKVIKR